MTDLAAAPPRLARLGTATAFFLDGMTIASWVTRIPAMQERLHIGNATLGLTLLMSSAGALIAMPITGRLVDRHGSRRVTVVSAVFFGTTLVLPSLAGSVIALGVALLFFGMGFGAMDVAINAQAVTVERKYDRPIMASFHAIFSFGGIAGGLIGAGAAGHGLSPTKHFAGVAVPVVIAGVLLRWCLLDDRAAHTPPAEGHARSHARHLMLLGAIAFCSMFGEGAMADWTAVFLRQVSLADAAKAALGFTAFSTCMTLGRLVADRATLILGPIAIVRLGGAIAAGGLLLAMALPGATTAILGFGLVGAGLSSIVPTVFSAAGRVRGVSPAVAIATVSTTGYFGFLVGPPVIGIVSQASSLRWAIGLVVACCGVAIALARHVEPHDPAVGEPILPVATAAQEML